MIEINNTTKQKIPAAKIRLIGEAFLRHYRRPQASVSLAIVGPGRMRRLNRDYRGIDKTTDVLSFPASFSDREPERSFLGEVIINLSAVSQLGKYREVFSELALAPFSSAGAARKYIFDFLFVHGLLHLLGYEDDSPAGRRKMLQEGRDFLRKVL